MVDLRELLAWFIFYVLASLLAIIVSFFASAFFLPGARTEERSTGPVEQQFYLLLKDRASWRSGNLPDVELREEMTEEARAGFSRLLNEVRFRENCLGGGGDQGRRVMACFVNGEDIEFVG